MNIVEWIDKNIEEIKETALFGKYFDTILMERDEEIFYFMNPTLGIDLILREDLSVKAIHFFSGIQEGVQKYPDDLPFNLEFSKNRRQVRMMYGEPENSGGGDFSMIYGTTPKWDMYLVDELYMHLEFSEDEQSITLITLDSMHNAL